MYISGLCIFVDIVAMIQWEIIKSEILLWYIE